MFHVTVPNGRHNMPMPMRRVIDVDLFVDRLAAHRRTTVTVQAPDGNAAPYEAWRSSRPEPRLPTMTIDQTL